MEKESGMEPRSLGCQYLGLPITARRVLSLPDELRTDLPDAWSASVRDVAKGIAGDVPARIQELCVVEDVEEFPSNFESLPFSDGDRLRHAQVGVIHARAVEESPIGGAKCSA